jgi:hypothetical protein
LRFKPPAAVFLIELVQHAAPLCPRHAGLDPGDGGLGTRQDCGMVGEHYPKRAGRRWDVAVSPCRSDHRPGLDGLAPPHHRRASRIANHGYATVQISAHGREIEGAKVIADSRRQRFNALRPFGWFFALP